jgi:hypothetical protein
MAPKKTKAAPRRDEAMVAMSFMWVVVWSVGVVD